MDRQKIIPVILTVLRWLYALLFLFIGTRSLLAMAGIIPPGEYSGSPESMEFTEAIFSKGFIGPVMSITYTVCGILIIIKRTAPLGLVLLAPFIISILLTHLLYEPNPYFGVMIASIWFILTWQFRKTYRPMWNNN